MQNNFRKFKELVFCDLWFPNSGFRFPIPDSGSRFRFQIPVSGFRVLGLPLKNPANVFIYRFQGWSYCSELALRVESEMIVFTSGLFIFLSDDNSPRTASFSSSKFFLFLNFTRSGRFFSKDTWKLNWLSSSLSSGIWPPPLWNFQFSLCWVQYYAEHFSRKAQIALVLK